jgi:hypothetical protein
MISKTSLGNYVVILLFLFAYFILPNYHIFVFVKNILYPLSKIEVFLEWFCINNVYIGSLLG